MLKKNLIKEYPMLQISGMYAPPFRRLTKEEDEEVIRIINETKLDFLWIGLGAPKQEIWMAAHKNKVSAVMIGVGAGVDFHAGVKKERLFGCKNVELNGFSDYFRNRGVFGKDM